VGGEGGYLQTIHLPQQLLPPRRRLRRGGRQRGGVGGRVLGTPVLLRLQRRRQARYVGGGRGRGGTRFCRGGVCGFDARGRRGRRVCRGLFGQGGGVLESPHLPVHATQRNRNDKEADPRWSVSVVAPTLLCRVLRCAFGRVPVGVLAPLLRNALDACHALVRGAAGARGRLCFVPQPRRFFFQRLSHRTKGAMKVRR